MRLLSYIQNEEKKEAGTIYQVSSPDTYQTCCSDKAKGRKMFILWLSNYLGANDSPVMTKYGLPSTRKTNSFSINESLSFPG